LFGAKSQELSARVKIQEEGRKRGAQKSSGTCQFSDPAPFLKKRTVDNESALRTRGGNGRVMPTCLRGRNRVIKANRESRKKGGEGHTGSALGGRKMQI